MINKENIVYVTNTNDSGEGSLRNAILSITSSGIICIDCNVSGKIVLQSAISVAGDIIIINKGYCISIINESDRVFNIYSTNLFRIQGNPITLTGNSLLNGGAIFNKYDSAKLVLINVSIVNSFANNGGAIYSNGNVILKNCLIYNNYALYQGGAIFTNNGITVNATKISKNKITSIGFSYGGGALYNDNGNIIIQNNSYINKNLVEFNETTGGSGGAIINNNGNIIVQKCSQINHNTAFNSPGILQGKGDVVISEDCILLSNKSTNPNAMGNSGGGAITIILGNLFASNSKFESNYSTGMYGSVVVILLGSATFNDCCIFNNYSNGPGVISLNFDGNVSITNSSINCNIGASLGGAIVNFSDINGSIFISKSSIKDNKVSNNQTILQTIGSFVSVITSTLNNVNLQAALNGGIGGQILITSISLIISRLPLLQSRFDQIIPELTLLGTAIGGGAIATLFNINIVINESTFKNNLAGFEVQNGQDPFIGYGGSIFTFDKNSKLTISTTYFYGNKAKGKGGVYFGSSNLSLELVSLIKNKALLDGGALYNKGILRVDNTVITKNCALNLGGGIYNEDGELNIINSYIECNKKDNIYSTNTNITKIENNDYCSNFMLKKVFDVLKLFIE